MEEGCHMRERRDQR